MTSPLQKLDASLNLRNTLIVIIVGLLAIAGNLKWQSMLRVELDDKKNEIEEMAALLKSESELKAREREVKALQEAQGNPSSENWKDSIPSFVSEQKLILRQVRPLGIEQHGKLSEDGLLVQLEGDIKGLTSFLHQIASSQMPIYAGQVSVTTQTFGSGFVTAELILAKPIIES